MNAENVRINLRYDRADLKSLLRYARLTMSSGTDATIYESRPA